MTRMDAVVETRCGKLRGCLAEGVAVLKGIPYAVPPIGANRLLLPRPVARWDGTREALAFGPKSPQVASPPAIAEALAELIDAVTNLSSGAVDRSSRPKASQDEATSPAFERQVHCGRWIPNVTHP